MGEWASRRTGKVRRREVSGRERAAFLISSVAVTMDAQATRASDIRRNFVRAFFHRVIVLDTLMISFSLREAIRNISLLKNNNRIVAFGTQFLFFPFSIEKYTSEISPTFETQLKLR